MKVKTKHQGDLKNRLRKKIFRLREFKFCLREIGIDFLKPDFLKVMKPSFKKSAELNPLIYNAIF